MGWAGVNDIWITCSLVQIRISPIYQERYLSPANKGTEQVFPFLPFLAFPYTPEFFTPWKLKMIIFKKRNLILQASIFKVHVRFEGCTCERMRAQFDFGSRSFLSVSRWRSSSWRWWCGGRLEMESDPHLGGGERLKWCVLIGSTSFFVYHYSPLPAPCILY